MVEEESSGKYDIPLLLLCLVGYYEIYSISNGQALPIATKLMENDYVVVSLVSYVLEGVAMIFGVFSIPTVIRKALSSFKK